MSVNKRVVVVGAGFGGLSVAALLAKQGHSVIVLEKNEGPGGRASVWEKDGFRFDMGPSWYLMRDVFNRFFGLFGKQDADFYAVERLDPSYRIFFDKDDVVDIFADFEKSVALFNTFEENGGEKLRQYVDRARLVYESSMEAAVYRDITSFWDFVRSPELRKSGRDLPLLETMDGYIKKYFRSEKAQKILQYTIVFLGGSPKNTPALYSLMSHVDFNMGVWYPRGGYGSVVNAMVVIGKGLGVEYRYGSEVKSLKFGPGVKGDQVSTVCTTTGEYNCDLVIMNGDMVYAETQLLPVELQTYPLKYWDKKVISPSAFLIYLGLKKRLMGLSHHNLFFAGDWTAHFNDIFDRPTWPDDPSYYVNCPSKTDAGMAPEGCENLFLLVPVAAGLEDSDRLREVYAVKMLSHLEKILGESIQDHIVVKRVFAHRDFSERYHAYKGTALGLSHTLWQSSIFRPQHRSKKVSNLYYTGQYTNPGIGTAICVISGMHVAEAIEKEEY